MPRFVTLFLLLFAAFAVESSAAAPPDAFRIGGIVVDSLSDQPLGLVEVTIAPETALDDAQTFLTNPDGRFLFANLAPGKYRLTAGHRGYAVQGFNQHEAYMTAIVAGPGQDSEHLRFRLSPSAVLSGTISDQWNDPVRNASVMLYQQGWSSGSRGLQLINRATTDDLGHYRFAHLAPGTYAIGVFARPWWDAVVVQPFVTSFSGAQSGSSGDVATLESIEPAPAISTNPALDFVYPITYFPDATSLADAARLSLPPGGAETADVTLRPVPSIHLLVRVPAAAPVPDASSNEVSDGDQNDDSQTVSRVGSEVTLEIGGDDGTHSPATGTEISPGLFELFGIPPGDATLTFRAIQGDGESVRTQPLQLSSSTEVDLNPHAPLADVSGVVVMPRAPSDQLSAGDKSPPFLLQFRSPKTGETYRATVSNKGEFSFAASALPAGTYEVGLNNESLFQISSLEAVGATLSRRTIEIPADQSVKLTVHLSEAKCSVGGFALKDGKPFAGAMILLVPQDPGQNPAQFHRDQSDSDGSFYMAPIFPGRYTLLALENGWDLEWSNPAVLAKYLPNGRPLELLPNAAVTFNAKVQ
jgi:Carboxypeptidase regulatory-like domain